MEKFHGSGHRREENSEFFQEPFINHRIEIGADGHEVIFDDVEKGIEGFRGLFLRETQDIGKANGPCVKESSDMNGRSNPFNNILGELSGKLVYVVELILEVLDEDSVFVGLGWRGSEGL